MSGTVTFYLPFGLDRDGTQLRRGTMRLATTLDELDIQTTDEVGMNSRYRDIILLSRVIEELDGVSPITPEMIEELFEADFLYLQLLYKELNGDAQATVTATCPSCGHEAPVKLPTIYGDMTAYRSDSGL